VGPVFAQGVHRLGHFWVLDFRFSVDPPTLCGGLGEEQLCFQVKHPDANCFTLTQMAIEGTIAVLRPGRGALHCAGGRMDVEKPRHERIRKRSAARLRRRSRIIPW